MVGVVKHGYVLNSNSCKMFMPFSNSITIYLNHDGFYVFVQNRTRYCVIVDVFLQKKVLLNLKNPCSLKHLLRTNHTFINVT